MNAEKLFHPRKIWKMNLFVTNRLTTHMRGEQKILIGVGWKMRLTCVSAWMDSLLIPPSPSLSLTHTHTSQAPHTSLLFGPLVAVCKPHGATVQGHSIHTSLLHTHAHTRTHTHTHINTLNSHMWTNNHSLLQTKIKRIYHTFIILTMHNQPCVNFINVLRTAFTLVGPKSVKRYWQLDWVITLWGTTGVKAVRRTLMKSSPGWNNKQ